MGATRRAAVAVAVALLLAVGLIAVPTAASAAPGDIGVEGASYTGATNPTADKPQSKLWYHDGRWWANMFDPGTTDWYVFYLDRSSQTWKKTATKVDDRPNTSSDALWDGTNLYIGTHVVRSSGSVSSTTAPMRLYKYSWDGSKFVSTGSPTLISNNSSESLTIDKDSVGTVWATWTKVTTTGTPGAGQVFLNSLTANASAWGTPFVVPTTGSTNPNVAQDDISALVAFGGNRVGVLWSNQKDGTVYWSVHADGAPPTTWAGGIAVRGNKLADDHLNIKSIQADQAGRVFAAVKTSLDQAGAGPDAAQINLLVFKPGTGAWTSTTFGRIRDCHTRPQVMLDETNQKVYVFATGRTAGGTCTSTGAGSIYMKSTSMDSPSFSTGDGTPVLRKAAADSLNNVTTTKQSVTSASGLVILASHEASKRYWHNDISLGGTPPPPPGDTTAPTVTGVSPADGATGVAVSSNVTGTFSEAMDAATIGGSTFTLKDGAGAAVAAGVSYDGATRTATLNPTADLANSATYTATITTGVTDTAGNPLAAERTWSFTTAAAAGGVAETVTLTAIADSYVAAGTAGSNFGTSPVVAVDGSPVEIGYLKFDLSAYAGRTVTAATLQVRSAGSGSNGTQNVKLVADDGWTETGVTYSNRPALGSAVGTLGPTVTNTNYSVTLTAAGVQGELGGLLSLGLDSTSGDGLDLNSRETANPPRLVLTLSGSVSGTPDTTAPTVSGVSPADGATGVAVSSNVTGTFSEAMDAATIGGSTFTL